MLNRAVAAFLLFSPVAAAQGAPSCLDCPGAVWYVDDDSAANGPGTSWATAFKGIKSAQSAAKPGDCIWVAEGTYRPSGLNQAASFHFNQATTLYGGFRGDEVCLADRAGQFRKTVLSGDIGVPGSNADNTYTILEVHGPVSNGQFLDVTFDGFLITGANNTEPGGMGGALDNFLGLVTFRNCTLRDNHAKLGGAIYTEAGTVAIVESRLKKNSAVDGGAIWGMGTGVTIQNSKITDNVAKKRGGGIYLTGTAIKYKAVIGNALLRGNSADEGGAVYLRDGDPPSGIFGTLQPGRAELVNCTVVANHATTRGPSFVANDDSSFTTLSGVLKLRNSIVWGGTGSSPEIEGIDNVDVVTTIVPPGSIWAVGSNLGVDPMLGRAPRYRLLPGSPAIDSGDALLLPADQFDLDGDLDLLEPIPVDLDGRPRIQSGTVDRGTYEF